ncbi:hypothetical protein ABK040_011915 [Willaertia magna]
MTKKQSNKSCKFNAEEDKILLKAFEKHGPKWTLINEKYFNSKFKVIQLYQRVHRKLLASTHEWTEMEDIELLICLKKMNGSWSKVKSEYYCNNIADITLYNRYKGLQKSREDLVNFIENEATKKQVNELFKAFKKAREMDPDEVNNVNCDCLGIIPRAKEGTKKKKPSANKKRKNRTTKTKAVVDVESEAEEESYGEYVQEEPCSRMKTRNVRIDYSKFDQDSSSEGEEEDTLLEPKSNKRKLEKLRAIKSPSMRSITAYSSSTAPLEQSKEDKEESETQTTKEVAVNVPLSQPNLLLFEEDDLRAAEASTGLSFEPMLQTANENIATMSLWTSSFDSELPILNENGEFIEKCDEESLDLKVPSEPCIAGDDEGFISSFLQ